MLIEGLLEFGNFSFKNQLTVSMPPLMRYFPEGLNFKTKTSFSCLSSIVSASSDLIALKLDFIGQNLIIPVFDPVAKMLPVG